MDTPQNHDNIVKVTFGGNKADPQPVEPEELLVYVCGACSCRTFNIQSDGKIVCSSCDEPTDYPESHSDWRRLVKPVPKDTADLPDDGRTVNNSQVGSKSLAVNRVMKRLKQWVDMGSARIIIGYDSEGAGSAWMDFENEEQRAWVLRQLDDVRQYVKGFKL